VRLTLVSLLLIPLLSLAALWGFTASVTLGNIVRYQHYHTIISTIGPSVGSLEEALPLERAVTLIWLGGGRRSALVQGLLTATRRGTDKDVPATRRAVISVRGLLSAQARARMNVFLADLAQLGQIRAAVDSGASDTVTAYNAYSAISTAEIQFFQNVSPVADAELSLIAESAITEARTQLATGGAISLIEAAIAAGGLMPQPERVLFAQVVGDQNQGISDTFALAAPVLTALFKNVYDLPAFRRLQAIETQVEASPASRPIPVDPVSFQAIAQAIQAALVASGPQVPAVLAAQSNRLRDRVVTGLVLATGLGLAAVAASVFVTVRFGRRFGGEFSSLYQNVSETASERLPRLVERLRRGEDVDVEAESQPPTAGRITEIANVARAFWAVQRTAAEAAVGQASLRKGVNQVFVNLSLRNQSLLRRLLAMLDDMERATTDPAILADLFRLDHLTTRMRRHAEGLLILAGTTPGRGWRDPVPIADVLQAAIAEVEDFVRVDVITDCADAVAGPAVNDVIHLIAELIENATAFSPPSTQVEISGGIVAHGFAVEIEDRGLGMEPDVLAALNERLASPPELDLANSERLGLFLVGRLAARHGIKVTLRPSPYGGITAIVLLPGKIIVPEQEADGWFGPGRARGLAAAATDRPHEGGTARSRQRAAALGMTGRHHLALAASALADGGTGPPGEPGPVPVAPASVSIPADPAQTPPETLMATKTPARAAGPAGPAGPAGVGGSLGSTEATGAGPADGTYLGLPRRVRRASLAPQLRRQADAAPGASHSAPLHPREGTEPAPSPELAGSRLAALQDGWLRGRLDDLDGPGAAPDHGGQPDSGPGGEAEPNDGEVTL
jgi:signal transduction histidine kinase